MKIRIVHTLHTDWLLGVRINTSIVSVLEIYMTSRYMLITSLIYDNKYNDYVYNV